MCSRARFLRILLPHSNIERNRRLLVQRGLIPRSLRLSGAEVMHVGRFAALQANELAALDTDYMPAQNTRCRPSQTTRLPASGPKNPPGLNVLVITPKLAPQHEVFGLLKWGVLVKL